jgi:hypothetical protein
VSLPFILKRKPNTGGTMSKYNLAIDVAKELIANEDRICTTLETVNTWSAEKLYEWLGDWNYLWSKENQSWLFDEVENIDDDWDDWNDDDAWDEDDD